MSDIAADMLRAYELRGDTYSSAEIWGLLGRGAAEIERLRADNHRLMMWNEGLQAERDELLAALQDIASLPGYDPANPFLADAMERLARAVIAKAEGK